MEQSSKLRALELAKEAFSRGEIPVGCVIERNGRIIAEGRNMCEELDDATAHAEIMAIRQAGRHLEDCELYVTLEPCPMCAGAIMNAGVGTVIYGARNELEGALGSVVDLNFERFPHRCRVFSGELENESSELLKSFFKEIRNA